MTTSKFRTMRQGLLADPTFRAEVAREKALMAQVFVDNGTAAGEMQEMELPLPSFARSLLTSNPESDSLDIVSDDLPLFIPYPPVDEVEEKNLARKVKVFAMPTNDESILDELEDVADEARAQRGWLQVALEVLCEAADDALGSDPNYGDGIRAHGELSRAITMARGVLETLAKEGMPPSEADVATSCTTVVQERPPRAMNCAVCGHPLADHSWSGSVFVQDAEGAE